MEFRFVLPVPKFHLVHDLEAIEYAPNLGLCYYMNSSAPGIQWRTRIADAWTNHLSSNRNLISFSTIRLLGSETRRHWHWQLNLKSVDDQIADHLISNKINVVQWINPECLTLMLGDVIRGLECRLSDVLAFAQFLSNMCELMQAVGPDAGYIELHGLSRVMCQNSMPQHVFQNVQTALNDRDEIVLTFDAWLPGLARPTLAFGWESQQVIANAQAYHLLLGVRALWPHLVEADPVTGDYLVGNTWNLVKGDV